MATATQNPRYEANESPSWLTSLGFGLQFAMIASATLLVTPVVVAEASDRGEPYVAWMVFASLVVVGLSTLLQVRRLGPLGAGAALPMATAPFAIPFCITAVVDGGPATLLTLSLASALFQLVISRWLFILRRIVTPVVSGTVMMILSVTLASVVFALLDDTAREEPVAAPLTALATFAIVIGLMLRGSALWRLWAPAIGIVVGCVVAAAFGIYDPARITESAWAGLPAERPALGLDFSAAFWTLLPAFLFMGVIISIQGDGESIAHQHVSHREARAVDFREVQGTMAGAGMSNVLAGVAGTTPNVVNPGMASFIQVTGVASRRVGYCIGAIFLVVAFLPKLSGLFSSIPGPVMAGYLIFIVGTLFVDGARTVVQSEQNRQRLTAAGVSFWLGAAFHFDLFTLPNLGSVWGPMLDSAITTGGLAVVILVLFLEVTKRRRMRFESELDADALPDLFAFIERFAESRRWSDPMKERLSAAAEETLLTLAPLDLTGEAEEREPRRLVVLASNEGPVAELEFIGGTDERNLEDRIRQLQQHGEETSSEDDMSLRLLRRYALSVRHQQFHGSDIIMVRVGPPAG